MKHLKTLHDIDRAALDEALLLQDSLSQLRLEGEGGDDGEDDDDPDDDDDDPDDGSGDGEEDEPLSKEEAAKLRAALKKANGEAKKHRLELKKLRKDNESDQEAAIRVAREEEGAKYHKVIARQAFRTALIEAGLTTGLDRLAKMLDFDDVEVDEDGDVSGLEEQVKALKKDFPELFSKRRGVEGKGDAGNKNGGVGSKKSSAEKMAAIVNG